MNGCLKFCFLCFLINNFINDAAFAADYQLYFLGGQSNMDGYGYTKKLPAELSKEINGVMIFHGNSAPDAVRLDGRGKWSPLLPGNGAGFRSDGSVNQLSDRFGPELTFGRHLRQLNPNTKVAIIKYSRRGTSIDHNAPNAKIFGCWDPDFKGGKGIGEDVNQYDHFRSTVRNALAVHDIDGDGKDDSLMVAGIVWMQGESDAVIESVAKRYETNLRNVIARLRITLSLMDHDRRNVNWDNIAEANTIPVVIGRIADSGRDVDGKVMDYGDIIQTAQTAFVNKDKSAVLVTSTEDYIFLDNWHYDTEANIDLGRQFANSITDLSNTAKHLNNH